MSLYRFVHIYPSSKGGDYIPTFDPYDDEINIPDFRDFVFCNDDKEILRQFKNDILMFFDEYYMDCDNVLEIINSNSVEELNKIIEKDFQEKSFKIGCFVFDDYKKFNDNHLKSVEKNIEYLKK